MGLRPSASTIATTDNYISFLDYHMPEIDPTLHYRYTGKDIFALFDELKQDEPTAQTAFSHYEMDYYYTNVLISTGATAGGAGQGITITIGAGDHIDGSTYPQPGQTVMFKNEQLAYIYSKDTSNATANTLTVYPLDDATLTIANGEYIAVITNMWAEESDQPLGTTPRMIKMTNNTQIFKKTYTISGSEMTNKVWVKVKGPNGQMEQRWMWAGWEASYQQYRVEVQGGMVFGKHVTNTILQGLTSFPGGGVGIPNATEGMFPFCVNQGATAQHTGGSGLFNIGQFDSLSKKWDKAYAPVNQQFWAGANLSIDWDNAWIDYNKDTGIDWSAIGGRADLALKYDFQKGIEKNGFKIIKTKWDTLTDPNGVGTTGFPFGDFGLFVPTGKYMNKGTGKMENPAKVRYKSMDDYSRKMEHWIISGAGPGAKQITIDKNSAYWRSEQAFEGFFPNKWTVVNP